MVDHRMIDVMDLIIILNRLAGDIHDNACNKGFYEEKVPFPQSIALIHSEASEALEAHRALESSERVAEELADIVIRVFDTAAYHSLNIGTAIITKMEKNKLRGYKHGKRY